MRAAVGGLATALVFALDGGTWLSDAVGEMHPADPWGPVSAGWFVLWSSLPVVMLAGVLLRWGVSSLLGSRRAVVVHVVGWAAIELALGAVSTAALGGLSSRSRAPAASAGLGCAVGAVVVLPPGFGHCVLSCAR